jgi:hypothetical protein
LSVKSGNQGCGEAMLEGDEEGRGILGGRRTQTSDDRCAWVGVDRRAWASHCGEPIGEWSRHKKRRYVNDCMWHAEETDGHRSTDKTWPGLNTSQG